MEDYLIANGYNFDGTTSEDKIGKSIASISGWNTSSTVGEVGNDKASNNLSGFSALPGGRRNGNGIFFSEGDNAHWWSSSSNFWSGIFYIRNLQYNSYNLNRADYTKNFGLSVRCLCK